MKKLMEIFDKFKCDKGSIRHRYDRIYEPILNHLHNKEINMLEIGIFKGSSIKAWREYFPQVNIYGIDIFTRFNPEELSILTQPHVYWCSCDSTRGPNDDFNQMVDNLQFDIIIDDGLHTHDAQRQTFENFIPYLKTDGIYFIEDVWAFDYMDQKQKNHYWIIQHPQDYTDEKYTNLKNTLIPYHTTFHDLRSGFYDDTFIIEIRK